MTRQGTRFLTWHADARRPVGLTEEKHMPRHSRAPRRAITTSSSRVTSITRGATTFGAITLAAVLGLGLGAPSGAFAAGSGGTPPSSKPPVAGEVPTTQVPAPGTQGGTASAGQVPQPDPTQATTPEAAGSGSSGVSTGADSPSEGQPAEAAGSGSGTGGSSGTGTGGTSGSGTGSTPSSAPDEAPLTTPDWPTTPGLPTIAPHDDVYAVASGHTVRIDWADLVSNDSNSAGLAILPAGHTSPSHGSRSDFSALDSADRFISYTADVGFVGTDSFQYPVRDSAGNVGSASGTVIVHVVAQKSPVVKNDSYTARSYHSLTVSGAGLAMNDTDADGDQITVKLLPAFAPQHGTVTLDPGALGGFTYTPTPGYVGQDVFGYQAVDGYGGSSLLGVVTITVLDEIHASGSPVIVGTPAVGYWLQATPPGYTPSSTTIAYQWYRGANPVPGATQQSYQLKDADAGSTMSVRLLASNPGMQSLQWNSLPTAVVGRSFSSKPVPTISGTARVGSKLTADPGSWVPAADSVSYQWTRNGAPIAGATASTRTLSSADKGAKIAAGVLAATPVPTVSGTARVGSKLTSSAGTWAGPGSVALAYAWKRDGVAITGATSATYTPVAADKGKALTVTVTGTKSGYTSVSKTSAPTAKVAAK